MRTPTHPQPTPTRRLATHNYIRRTLIRRWLRKGTDLSTYTQTDLDRIAHRINTIPRRSLGWTTAAHHYHHAVAMTG